MTVGDLGQGLETVGNGNHFIAFLGQQGRRRATDGLAVVNHHDSGHGFDLGFVMAAGFGGGLIDCCRHPAPFIRKRGMFDDRAGQPRTRLPPAL